MPARTKKADAAKAAAAAPEAPAAGADAPSWKSRLPQPTLRLRTGASAADSWPASLGDALARGLAGFEANRDDDALPVAKALLPDDSSKRLALLETELRSRALEPNHLVAVYGLAAEKVATGALDDAAMLLAVLTGWPAGEFDGYLGLAVLAARHDDAPRALQLAERALKTGVKHPLAYCIAGMMQLKLGDRKTAQARLAAAARLARTDSRYRDDLRTAQQALLLMHLS